MSSFNAIISAVSAFFKMIFSIFQNKHDQHQVDAEKAEEKKHDTDVSIDVLKESEEMQSEIAQKQTSRPESQSDILKRLNDHDA